MTRSALDAIDRELAWLREWAAVPRPGCWTVSHDRLGFCAVCAPGRQLSGMDERDAEVMGWRLLALREREAVQ